MRRKPPFETKPVVSEQIGIMPPVVPMELAYDLVLPWCALFSDELDVRWGPAGASLALLPGITIVPHIDLPPRWMDEAPTWPEE